MTAPDLSVIIPCFNREDDLRRALRSVQSQTFVGFEVVVGDDASEHPLEEVVASFDDPRMRTVRRPVNGGIGAARNTAIASSRGALLSFLDSDDEWHPDHLAVQLDGLRAAGPDVDAVTTGFRMAYPDGRSEDRLPRQHDDLLARIVRGVDLSAGSTMMLRREAFDRIGPWPEDIRRNEDYDWFLRYAEAGLQLQILPELTVVIHSDDRAPLDLAVSRESWAVLLDRHVDLLRARDPSLVRHLRAKGHEELAWAAWRSRALGPFAAQVAAALALDPVGRAPKLSRSMWRRVRHRTRRGRQAT